MSILYPGAKVRIGQRDLIIPALTVRLMKKHKSTLIKARQFVSQDPTDEDIDKMVEVVYDAAKRNYPDMTLEELQDDIDMNNLPLAIAAVTGQSQLELVPSSGEGQGGR